MNEASTETTEDPNWWHKVECHLSPKWGLPDLDQYMLHTIKDTYQFEFDLNILPNFMTIERLLFSAWIELSHCFFTKKPSTIEAVCLVQQANEYLEANLDRLGDDSLIGYGTIIYAFLMWIHHKSGSTKKFKEAEEKLKKLCRSDLFQSESNTLVPNCQIYIDVTHAWALGRLGSEKRCKSLRLLNKALKFKNKKHGREQWLAFKAFIEGRSARKEVCFDDCQRSESSNLLKMLTKEKQTLKDIIKKWNLAKAHLGTVMIVLDNIPSNPEMKDTKKNAKKDMTDKRNQKRTNETAKQDSDAANANALQNTTDESVQNALVLIKESLAGANDNDFEVALILSRLNKDLNKRGMLQDILEYCETKINIARENRPSDVYLQLGLLYYKQGKLTDKLTDETSMMDKALNMVQKAVKTDKKHLKARLWKAMILANPHNQKSEEAKEIFSKIQQESYSNTATKLHILGFMSSSSVRSIYDPLQYLQNVFEFLLLCVKHHVRRSHLGVLNFESVVRKDAHQRMDILQKKVGSDSGDKTITNGAIMYLAKINLYLERYTEAEELFKLLKSEYSSATELETEVKCGLAKCFYRLGKFQELRELDAVKKEDCEDSRQYIKEIKELVYLAEGKEKQHEMMAKCEDAIELGSLDGCLLMLNMYQHFQERFFVFRERFVHRLAKIKHCMKRDEAGSQQVSYQGQKQNKNDKVKQIVAENINAVLMYCRSQTVVHESHESVYKKLEEIRGLLLDFEYILLFENSSCSTKEGFLVCADRQCSNTEQQLSPETPSRWSHDCRKAATDILEGVRFLLDEVMGCLQIAVLGQKHHRSEFPIIVNWEKLGHQDKEEAKGTLQKRLSTMFTDGYELYIPELVFDCLLKIQPMFDKENEWLLILSRTVNGIKHDGLVLGPVCQYTKDTFHRQLCTSYVVRRSCEEVEKFTLFLLNKCTEMM